jgi:hypothetical protein
MVSIRIAVLPSFERTEVWEIRRVPETGDARLYVARSAEPGARDVALTVISWIPFGPTPTLAP